MSAAGWPARERHLCRAYEAAAQVHNQLRLTSHLDPRTRPFHDRPYQVLDAGRFSAALVAAVSDPFIRQLPVVGAVDQFVDSTGALGDLPLLRATIGATSQRTA